MSRKQPNPKPDNVEKLNPPPAPPKEKKQQWSELGFPIIDPDSGPPMPKCKPPKQAIAKRTRNKGPTIAALTEENEKLQVEVAELTHLLEVTKMTRDSYEKSLIWNQDQVHKLTLLCYHKSLWQRIKEVFVYGG